MIFAIIILIANQFNQYIIIIFPILIKFPDLISARVAVVIIYEEYYYNMNKCEHGEKITTFCASDCCVWKEAAGCDSCIKKYHNHMGPTIFLSQQEIIRLVKKYTMDSNIKPKCRQLQESIYSYFNQVKNQLTTSIDLICKNIINQIGYPYLYSNNTLSTYKKLKNKEYKKLIQKDFKALYELSHKISETDLAKEEARIYMNEMKNTEQLLNNIEDVVRRYELIVKTSHPNFAHDGTTILKVNQIIKTLRSEPHKLHKEIKQSAADRQRLGLESRISELSKLHQDNDLSKIGLKNELDSSPTRTSYLGSPPTLERPYYSRDVSIDRKIIKEPRFLAKGNHQFQKQQKQSGKQIMIQIKPPHGTSEQNKDKLQNLKKQLNNKEIQINEKKKILIDMIKQKQDSVKNKSNRQITQKSVEPKRIKVEVPSFFKQVTDNSKESGAKQEEKSVDFENMTKSESEQNSVNEIYEGKTNDVQNRAFTKLPLIQSIQKEPQSSEKVKQKLIFISTASSGLNQSEIGEVQSPLIKQINKQSRLKTKETIIETITIEKQTQIQQDLKKINLTINKHSEILQLKENQEKSLALLLKSLALSAQQAISHLEKALEQAENNLSAAEYLSYLYLLQGRPQNCLHLCNKMLQKLQNSSQPGQLSLIMNNNKAAALNILGRYSESIVILQKCLRYKQKDFFYKNLGDAYFSISIYEKAIYNYEKALQINENYDQAQYNLAVCLYIQQNYYNAQLAIKKALQVQPQNQNYLQLFANIETRINNC